MSIRLLLLGFFLLWVPPQVRIPGPGGVVTSSGSSGSSSPTLIAHTNAHGPSGAGVTTTAINTTGANVIVVFVDQVYGSPATISDSQGNTWRTLTNNGYGAAFSCLSCNVSSSHTFSESSNASPYPMIVAVLAFAVSGTAGIDDSSSNVAYGQSSLQTGSITTTVSGDLLVTAVGGWCTLSSMSVNSGFTIVETSQDTANACFADAWQVQSAAGAINPTWTGWTGPDRMSAAAWGFK
jgi:hypothetical protein